MKIIKGDLIKLALDGKFDVIVHGCNCFCVMGLGIAKTMKETFPEAYQADLSTRKGDKSKLGSYTSATVKCQNNPITIVNAYTQFNYRGRGVRVDYEAMRSVFAAIQKDFSGLRIGYPLIGAGLAGGDWAVIAEIIEDELEGEDHTLVEYVPAN